MTSATDKQLLESRAIAAISNTLGQNEDVAIYIDNILESMGYDTSSDHQAMTEIEMEAHQQTVANLWCKLLAKVIGDL